MTDAPPPKPRTSTRNLDDLRGHLTEWLGDRLGGSAAPTVSDLIVPEANGMSSETFLFDVTYRPTGQSGRPVTLPCVGRMAPDLDDDPVFPSYDLPAQAAAMREVADRTDAPVPVVHFSEPDASVLGAPFLVMGRVDGRVPPDVMPYTFEGWLLDAEPADRRALQDATVRCLAQVHRITPDGIDPRLTANYEPDGSALRRHVEATRAYVEWVAAGRTLPLIERSLDWLEANWPSHESPPALSWGDARIGNVIYDGFEPVALLDWEMVGIAPPEVDLGWIVFLHRFFQDLAEQLGLPGIPDLLRLADVRETYAAASGSEPADLEWFVVSAAVRHAAVMTRVGERMALVAGTAVPDDLDELVMHRAALAGLLDGTDQATR
jgi:aminoglycoside phosphotransferase (APT) family kinase protein